MTPIHTFPFTFLPFNFRKNNYLIFFLLHKLRLFIVFLCEISIFFVFFVKFYCLHYEKTEQKKYNEGHFKIIKFKNKSELNSR